MEFEVRGADPARVAWVIAMADSDSISGSLPSSDSAASVPTRLEALGLRVRAMVQPLGVIAIATLAVHGLATGFGALEIAGILVSLGLLAIAYADGTGIKTLQLLILLGVSGVMLLAVDVVVLLTFDSAVKKAPLYGIFEDDPEAGFRLTPNSSLAYPDRVVGEAIYTINALGHRDSMPTGRAGNRVLLLGDSMTFGELLQADETIDAAIETASGRRFDAYNLGVPGYGAEASAIALERNTIPARSAIYFFYTNDLRNDGFELQRYRVWKGFIVPRLDANGNDMSERELDARVARNLETSSRWFDVLRLRHLFTAIEVARRSHSSSIRHELPTHVPGLMGYRPENVELAVAHTQTMQRIANERGLAFAVAALPSMAEASQGRRYALVDAYLERVRALGIETVDTGSGYDASDYYTHDGHFGPLGAEKTALRVIDWLDGHATALR